MPARDEGVGGGVFEADDAVLGLDLLEAADELGGALVLLLGLAAGGLQCLAFGVQGGDGELLDLEVGLCVGEVLGAGVEPFSDVEQGEDLVFADGEQALAEALDDDGPVGVDGFDKALAVLGDLGEPLLCVGDLLVVHGFLLLGGLELVAQRVELGVELV